jgi:hypothetical protein
VSKTTKKASTRGPARKKSNRRASENADQPTIDRDKLRIAMRRLGHEYIFDMLDAAIDVIPSVQLEKLAARYLDVDRLRPDPSTKQTLLEDVRKFDAVSRAGHYYQGFAVDSRNCMEQSIGTMSFISDCRRMFDRCIQSAATGDPIEVCNAFGVLLELLRYIDESNDDVVFFADEGGSWQVGVAWREVLPALFPCTARTVDAEEYAEIVVSIVNQFARHDAKLHFATALDVGTPAQREALRRLVPTI